MGQRIQIERNDMIAIIDDDAGTNIKGQNQRSYEIGVIPREILESTLVNEKIEKQSNNFIKSHSAVSFNNHQQSNGPGFSREKSFPTSKQFSYHKFKNEKNVYAEANKNSNSNGKQNNKNSPARPPQPRFEPRNGILIDLGPEDANSAAIDALMRNSKDNNRHSQVMTQCILDMPIPGTVDDTQQNIEFNQSRLPREYSTDSFESMQSNVYENQNAQYNLESYYSTSAAPLTNTYDEVHAGIENIYNNQEFVNPHTSQHNVSPLIPTMNSANNISPVNMNTYSNSSGYNVYNTPENYYDSVYSSAIYGDTRPNYSSTSPYQQLSDQQISRRMTSQRTTIEQLMEKLKLEQVTVEEASSALQKTNGNMDDAIKVFKIKRLET